MTPLHFYPSEKWKEVEFEHKTKLKYAISNYGRLISYTDKIENGRFLKGGRLEGYKAFTYKVYKKGKIFNYKRLVHRMVAEAFVKNNDPERPFVIHLDYHKTNNHAPNLKWVTQEELTEHNQKNPRVLKARKTRSGFSNNGDGQKLTSTQVRLIKKMLANPDRKTRKKIIAKQFGITPMSLYRIETGQNWGHIK
jgi:hypothetical protein